MGTGLIQIYCGDGKGKTTAAVGLAIRASGADLKVCFMQFMKNGTSSELEVLSSITNIEVLKITNTFGFTWKMTEEEKGKLFDQNSEAILKVTNEIQNYDVLVLDEILSAYEYQLVDRELVISLLEKRGNTEIILTGRNPMKELLAQADYITEMKCLRHPYEKGVQARKGIEF